MTERRPQRRLAAILAADVVGYSRLMAEDEAGTLSLFQRLRDQVIEPKLKRFGAEIVGSAGDSLLIEFASAVDAVECAVELQDAIAAQNRDLPPQSRMLFRIGVNLGDVIVAGDTIYGDGVNIAARLEKIAEPGGICLGHAIHEQVRGKLTFSYADLGEHRVHNIPEPVRAYKVLRPQKLEIASTESLLTEPPSVADNRPSIAVMPFANLSGAPERELFADGITEDIVSALSRIDGLFVVSRSSSHAYKGRNQKSQEIAKELGVRYLLDGSIRIAGERVRVTAQLNDGQSGNQLWSERYDSNLDDIFAVQDEITRRIALALQIKLSTGDEARLWEGQTKVLRAWEKMASARYLFNRFTIADNLEARRALLEALALDPAYTGAMILLGHTYWWEARFNPAVDRDRYLQLAEEQAQNVLNIDVGAGNAYMLLAQISLLRGRHEEAMQYSEKSLNLSPSDAWAHGVHTIVAVYAGEFEKAWAGIKKAMRLSPQPPSWLIYYAALAQFWIGNLDAALDFGRTYWRKEPDDPYGHAYVVAILGCQGDNDGAKDAVRALLERNPDFRIAAFVPTQHYKDPRNLARIVEVLRQAGLPE